VIKGTLYEYWSRYRRSKLAVAGLLITVSLVILALIAPYLPLDPFTMRYERAEILQGISLKHPMGTDHLGRDVFSRIIWGARVSLFVGFIAAGIATLIGVVLGLLAGYYGGWVDSLISAIVNVFLMIPTFFLVLTIVAVFGSNIYIVMTVIGLTMWPSTARLVRAQTLKVKELPYVEAIRALGASDIRIMLRSILPNAIQPAIVNGVLQMSEAVLIEAALSFLGLGDPTQVSWGLMLRDSQRFLTTAWWMAFFPGLMISLTVVALNVVGDGLNEIINPKPPPPIIR